MNKGLVYVFTGKGKGKTSAAIGTAVRAIGAGMKVGWVGWYKQEGWKLSELEPLRKLGVEVWLMGRGFHIQQQATSNKRQESPSPSDRGRVKVAWVGDGGSVVVDKASREEHEKAARQAVEKARELINRLQATRDRRQALLVLDEVNNAIADGLIDLIDLIDLISKRGNTHLVLTGRDVHPEVVALADLVTECSKVKHPYDSGELAVKGLDY